MMECTAREHQPVEVGDADACLRALAERFEQSAAIGSVDVEVVVFPPASCGNAMHAARRGEGDMTVPSCIDDRFNDASIITTPLGHATNLGTDRRSSWRRARDLAINDSTMRENWFYAKIHIIEIT